MSRRMWRLALGINMPVYMMVLSVAIGCVPLLRTSLSPRGPLGWLGNAWDSLGSCGVVLSTIVLGAGLCNSWRAERRAASSKRLATADGADGDARMVPHSSRQGNFAFVSTACLLRLVVLPALCLPLHLAMAAWGMLPRDPTLLMILSLSAGTPSAQTLVVVLNASGATTVAQEASKVYVPMYLLAIASVALLIFIVCVLVGEA